MLRFTPKTDTEELPLAWDLTALMADLPTGQTINSATVTATVKSGTDPSPSSIISGSAAVSGATVTQRVIGGVAGVLYTLRLAAVTAPDGYKIEEDAILYVRD